MAAPKGTILITGANGGLGSAFVSKLIKSPYGREYQGIYTVRNPSTAHDLQAVLKEAPATHIHETLALNLGSLKDVRAAAEDINTRVANGSLGPIRALILNAAFQEANPQMLAPQTFTDEGFEAAFGINYLANFLFVLLLLKSMDKEHGRIVMVSSWTHDPYDTRNNTPDIFKPDEYKVMFTETENLSKGITYEDDGYKAGMRRYGASKLLMVMFMYELQRRLDADPQLSQISAVSLDPGAMGTTSLTRRSPLLIRLVTDWGLWAVQGLAVRMSPNGMFRPTWKSADDLLLACFDVDVLGKYPKAVYLGGSVRAESSKESQDVQKQNRLWVDSLKLAGIEDGDIVMKSGQ